MREAERPGTIGTADAGAEAVAPFEIRRPLQQTEPFVFNSPHSGRIYPELFLNMSRLDREAIRRSESH